MLRPREIDVDQPSKTEQLSNWIKKVRCKKLMCRRNRKRNLRIEAVLSYALYKAEYELRRKQLSRISQWRKLKPKFLQNSRSDDHNCESLEYSEIYQESNLWHEPVCQELSSLNDFMLKLSEIKAPLQRWNCVNRWMGLKIVFGSRQIIQRLRLNFVPRFHHLDGTEGLCSTNSCTTASRSYIITLVYI